MNNTNGNLSQNVGKLLTGTDAKVFLTIKTFTAAVVYLENLQTQTTEAVDRGQFFKWINTGRLHFIN